jgi:hypothetical protein
MRYASWIGSLLLFAILSISASTRGTAPPESDLLTFTCSSGTLSVTAKEPWHTYSNGPWAWDKGSLVSKTATQVKFKGSACQGTVKAYIASGDQVKGPILVAIH